MDLLQTIGAIRDRPRDHLDHECALSLGAFVHGYRIADASAGPPMKELLRRIPGPGQADGFTRAYLAHGRGPASFNRAIQELHQAVQDLRPPPTAGHIVAGDPFIDHLRVAIGQGRPGMVLGEPTVVWLADHVGGFLAGLASVVPDAARGAAVAFRGFEHWLRDHYEQRSGRWYEMIRVFEGPTEHGLTRFVELWDEFQAETATSPA